MELPQSRRATKLFAEGHFKLHYSPENRTATVAAHTHKHIHIYTYIYVCMYICIYTHNYWQTHSVGFDSANLLICWIWFSLFSIPTPSLSRSLFLTISHFFPIYISIILFVVVVISMSGPALSVSRQQSLRSNELILALQWQQSQERGQELAQVGLGCHPHG